MTNGKMKGGVMSAERSSKQMKVKEVVLAIDDIPASLATVRLILRDEYDVRLAKSVKVAMQILNAVKIDVILLDIEMPDISGFEFLRYIRSMPDKKDIPVIFITGQTDSESINEARRNGANGYILKPLTAPILLEKIGAVFKNREIVEQYIDEDEVARAEMRAQYMNVCIQELLRLKNACKFGKSEEIISIVENFQRQNFGNELNRELNGLYEFAIRFDYDLLFKHADNLVQKLIK
jgi:response regulator RpfG family c-di-GMP phosphodiesterase